MIGIGRTGVIGRVTAVAGVRGGVVVAVVASGAIACDGGMRAIQHIIVVVRRERRRFPAWRRGVAHRAVVRDIERHVVGVAGLREIRVVAAVAGIRRVRVVAVVTGIAVVGNRNMRPRERINGIVIKGRWRPGCFCVAGGAVGRVLRSGVVGAGRSCIIGVVAAVAGVRRVRVIAVVASGTICGNGRMRAI